MAEETMFKGLWTCPGYGRVVNDTPPIRFECSGFELTEAGATSLVDYLMWDKFNQPQSCQQTKHNKSA